NVAGARIAREAAGDRFVAGSVGPLNVTLSLSPKVDDAGFRTHTFDKVKAAYAEQIAALVEGGVDVILLETIFDTLNAKAAITAARETAPSTPLWISATIVDLSGRTLSGQTTEAFWTSIEHADPLIVGVNCSLGAREMRPYVADLAQVATCLTSCHPNAGLPNAFGGYDETPDVTSTLLREFAQDGLLNIAGSCCGSTPEHTRAIAEAVRGLEPRTPVSANLAQTRFSGLETFELGPDTGFVLIGERTNVTGSARFRRLVGEAESPRQARRDRDSGARVVVMAFDEEGQATDVEPRVAICGRAYDLLVEQVGFPPEDIVFDPNVLAVATGMEEHDDYAHAFIE